MTFSLLAHDHETGTYGGAAATGSLCVGGWVLRGGLDSGLSASQGTAPSTFWGEDVLRAMRDQCCAGAAAGIQHFVPFLGVVERAEHNAADDGQVVLGQFIAQDCRVFGHKSDWPQFDPLIARASALLQHRLPRWIGGISRKFDTP